MWKKTIANSSLISRVQSFSKRTYLSKGYNLTQTWQARLSTPILKKVKIENLYLEIDTKFQQKKKISPVDVDIYANKVDDNKHMDEMADLMKKIRSTEEACNVFDSSQHALIRNYIDNDSIDLLIYVLDHRKEYGVFLDFYSANMLLDNLIKSEKFKLGARVATLLGLQEDFSNPITKYMSLLCCLKFLRNLETFDDLVEALPEENPDIPKEKTKKKVEEIKIRVEYLRNPYYDDHFDLKNTNHLLGKTLLFLADEVKAENEVLSNSLNLLGYCLYEKFEAGNKFLEEAKEKTFFAESVEISKLLKEKVENLEEKELEKQFFTSLDALKTKNEDVTMLLENQIKKAVQEQESKDIAEQKKIYNDWNIKRQEKLNEEIYRHERIQRLLNIEKMQNSLHAEEKKLWFFEKEDKIDLEIDEKRVFYPKRWFGKKKKPRLLDENYIPPDVDKRRNV